MKDWTFGRILAVGYAVAGAILLLVAAVGFRSTVNLVEDGALVTHTHDVRRELVNLVAKMTDVETSVRGFVISGDEAHLTLHEGAQAGVRDTLARLRTLTADNPVQQRRFADLAPLIEQRIAISERALAARREGGVQAGIAAVRTGEGKQAMDRIRAIVADADREEEALLARRAAAAASSASWTEWTIVGGSVLGLVLVVAIGWFTIRMLTRRIGSAVGHVESSSAELQAAANQQVASAREQAGAMNEIATTIRELIATSRQIAESAQRVAQVAEDTAATSRDGDKAVETANASISGIRRQVDQIVEHMLDLGRKSQQIGAVLDIVSELAEQSNILAINATIEAAGAGDAGKRFSVVADEIRKLSDRVADSTKEIRSLIDDMRAAVNTTVMATETGSKAVDAGSRQFEAVATSFREIAGMIETTTDAAREIELSTKQQSTAVEQVNIATSNVAQAATESEASSGQILQTASELTSLARDLARIVRRETRG
ncbi:CHASE3 domain-containing protein [Sphingomonas canadensis]|uniref:CHASE3 domain-containing protein n=1 Tax=Sphingomonas canadensis TaxID=1219257 RepID=A0ABW3H3V0_9SPHN|nr:CHASE3 domain-containing protein [Sphingomonas canadensis]MCW3834735.1 CHASE3 domain-containing protein [Sphingomonas canadensis]